MSKSRKPPTQGQIVAAHVEHYLGQGETLRPYDVQLWPAGPMQRGACLSNARALARAHPGMKVIFGEVFGSSSTSIAHAWVELDGIAYEVTWEELGQGYWGFPQPSTERTS